MSETLPAAISAEFKDIWARLNQAPGETVEASPEMLKWLDADYQARKDQTNA